MLSFPLTTIITEGILRVKYFSAMHTMAIFIILGIAADDVFVFMDAWKQSETICPEILGTSQKKRMAYTMRRSVRAMAVTSATTAAAFFANYWSPIMPIQSFGIFAGVLIPINFILVSILIPPATIWYEKKLKDVNCCLKK